MASNKPLTNPAMEFVLSNVFDGSESEMARFLGVSRQRIHMARRDGRKMPVAWAANIHRHTNGKVRAEMLRPDIFEGICE